MRTPRCADFLLLASVFGLLGGCSQSNTADVQAGSTIPIGLDRFLIFPNPIAQADGSFQTDSSNYASSYYAAVDPLDSRDTLAGWMAANGFGNLASGTEFTAVFRDVRDLGYGRRMTGRRNADGSIAFFVENYHVSVIPGEYPGVNVDAAVAQDFNWHVGTNAIEWSCHPQVAPCARMFAKYYNFDPASGQRQSTLDLDGRGLKSMPGICISCHGGRGDPLTPQPSYALVANSVTQQRGDTLGKLQPFHVDSFEWSVLPGFTRADQEAVLKTFNQWVLCTYPAPGGASVSGTWGSCTRPTADANEWQGTAAEMIEAWYGGGGMPGAQFSDTYLPAGWSGNAALYQEVVAPYCRTCHIVRGTGDQSDIDFTTETKFQGFAGRTKAHVFDRGNMPLAFLVYRDFWNSGAPAVLASYIDSVLGSGTATDGTGDPKRPGRLIADPGPDRMVRAGTNATLSATDSLFATTYSWTLVSGPGSAGISNGNSSTATFNATVPGVYTVRLTVGNGTQSDSATVDLTVDASFPDPATIGFAHVLDVLRNNPHGGTNCTNSSCHDAFGSAAPIVYAANVDRQPDGVAGDATDELWLLHELRGRANLTEIAASALLTRPTGNHHRGLAAIDLSAGSAAFASFSRLYWWIANGMPAGGVAANAGADSTEQVVFAGSPATAAVALSAAASIGATGYAWTIESFTPAAHPNGTGPAATAPSITSANSVNATLDAFDIGTYVIRLTASDGTNSDFDERTITVTESAVTASASPSGTQQLVFSGGPPTSSTFDLSSAGTTGSPLSYSWAYAPLSATSCGTISNATAATATLTVPESAIGQTCTFRLIASNLSTTDSADTTVTIAAAAGQNPTASYVAGTTTRCSVTGGSGSTPAAACTWAGSPFNATIALTASASGPGTLTYQWSVTSGPSGSSITNSTSQSATLNIVNDGSYTVQVFVDNGALSTGTTVTKTITVTANRTFTQVSAVFTDPVYLCTGCHSYANGAANPDPATNSGLAPSWANELDSNGKTLYQRVRDRVNLGTPDRSLLLLNPLNVNNGFNDNPIIPPNLTPHGGGTMFADTNESGYITFLTWIIGGALNN
jgi:PKD repeat protein